MAVLIAGCGGGGPSLAPVKGTVTKSGKPLAGISVTFTQTDKNFSAAGRTNDAGVFVLLAQNGRAGAMPGKNKVTVSVPSQVGSTTVNYSDPAFTEGMAKSRAASTGKKGAPVAESTKTEIPPEYSNPGKTPLEYEVKAGSNEFDIPIP